MTFRPSQALQDLNETIWIVLDVKNDVISLFCADSTSRQPYIKKISAEEVESNFSRVRLKSELKEVIEPAYKVAKDYLKLFNKKEELEKAMDEKGDIFFPKINAIQEKLPFTLSKLKKKFNFDSFVFFSNNGFEDKGIHFTMRMSACVCKNPSEADHPYIFREYDYSLSTYGTEEEQINHYGMKASNYKSEIDSIKNIISSTSIKLVETIPKCDFQNNSITSILDFVFKARNSIDLEVLYESICKMKPIFEEVYQKNIYRP